MADTTDDDPEMFESHYLAYLYVSWRQATPSASEIAALHRIDPALKGKGLADVAALLKGEDWWRLGPFVTEDEAGTLEAELRSTGCFRSVEKKWQ